MYLRIKSLERVFESSCNSRDLFNGWVIKHYGQWTRFYKHHRSTESYCRVWHIYTYIQICVYVSNSIHVAHESQPERIISSPLLGCVFLAYPYPLENSPHTQSSCSLEPLFTISILCSSLVRYRCFCSSLSVKHTRRAHNQLLCWVQ